MTSSKDNFDPVFMPIADGDPWKELKFKSGIQSILQSSKQQLSVELEMNRTLADKKISEGLKNIDPTNVKRANTEIAKGEKSLQQIGFNSEQD